MNSFRAEIRDRLLANGPLLLGGALSWWLVDAQTDPLVRAQQLWGNEWLAAGVLPFVLLGVIGLCWPRKWRARHAMLLPWLAGAATIQLATVYVRLVPGHF
jgi:hypothetical protein